MKFTTVFKPEEVSKSFKREGENFFVETSTTITMDQRAKAQAAGYRVEDKGTSLVATGKFPANPPVSIADAVEKLNAKNSGKGEEMAYALILSEWALTDHGNNRNAMKSTISNEIPKECKILLDFLSGAGFDVESFSFEQKASKEFLTSLIRR